MELRRKRAATPQKPSRLQPTEPLHMTTRAASKAASVSSNGGSSRRGSLMSNGQMSPVTGNDHEGERYPKRRRISAGSKSTPTRAKNSSQSSSSRPSTRSMSGGNLQPIAESPLPRKKRKRSSDVTAENISVAQPLKSRTEFEKALFSPVQKIQPPRKAKRSSTSSNEQTIAQSEASESHDANLAADEPEETVETSEDAQVLTNNHTQEAHGSILNGETNGTLNANSEDISIEDVEETPSDDDNEGPSDQQSTQQNEIGDSTEQPASQAEQDVPHGSADAEDEEQEVESEEGVEGEDDEEAELETSRDELILPKHLGVATLDPTPAVSATASPAGSNPDSNADQASPTKQLTSAPIGEAPTASQDGEKPVKRLPGRRRAPHPNPVVEAALRRQLHLRMLYRAVAKVQKPDLTELAKRSLNDIQKGPEAYKDFSEYSTVKRELDENLKKRVAWIQKQRELNMQKLKNTLDAEMEMKKRQYEHVARTIQEDLIVRVQHDFLIALRQQRQEQDEDHSDDEGDDVIPALRHVTPKGALRNVLGPEYHWRSRPALEIERLFDDQVERARIAREHRDHDKESAAKDGRPFTTFDPVIREAAKASRKMKGLVVALEEAAQEAARPAAASIPQDSISLPIIPNNEALGLLLLAEASITNNAAMPAMLENATVSRTDPTVDVPSRQEDLSVPRPSLSRAESQSTPAPSAPAPARPLEEPVSEQRPQTTVPISFSQAVLEPSTTQTAPLLPRSAQPEQQEQRSQTGLPQLPPIDQVVASQSHETALSQPVATHSSLPAPVPAKPVPTDFWSSLARGSYETDAHGKVKLAPKAGIQQTANSETPISSTPEGSRPEDRSSRPSLPTSSTILEPLHQRLRSTSDSFGPLIDRPGELESPRMKKAMAPKKSLYGPWPRSRNYNPLDRRASTTGPAPPPTLPGLHPRPPSGFGGPFTSSESRHASYTPAPPPPMLGPFPSSAAQSGPYPPAAMYAGAPAPPFAYEQRGAFPPPLNAFQAPSGFAGLAGAPISQSQAPPPFYGGPLPPPPPPPSLFGPPGSNSRPPPTAPTYGPQYGGQPILPAGHDGRFGPNGQAAAAAAGPAFAQYQQHDGRRRRNQSLGNREFQHYHGPR